MQSRDRTFLRTNKKPLTTPMEHPPEANTAYPNYTLSRPKRVVFPQWKAIVHFQEHNRSYLSNAAYPFDFKGRKAIKMIIKSVVFP